MLRAYIISSRAREHEKILLVQPYSPELFRQSTLPGPDLLMRLLLKDFPDSAETKEAWKAVEQREKQTVRVGGKWIRNVDTMPGVLGRKGARGTLSFEVLSQ